MTLEASERTLPVGQAKRAPTRSPVGSLVRQFPYGLAFLVGLYAGLPMVALLIRGASSEVLHALSDPSVLTALRLTSISVALVLLLSVVFGTPVAYLLARREFMGKRLLETILEIPIALPPLVAGVGLLMAFGRRGLLGPFLDRFGLVPAFTLAAVVMAQLIVSLPFYIRSAMLGFRAVPRELEEAASVDGAAWWQVFFYQTLPLAFPGIFAGMILCATRAASEFGAALMFAGNFPGRTQTMTLAIVAALETSVERALAISLILLVLAVAVVFIARRMVGRLDSGLEER